MQIGVMLRWHASMILNNNIMWQWKYFQIFTFTMLSPYCEFLLKGSFIFIHCQSTAFSLRMSKVPGAQLTGKWPAGLPGHSFWWQSPSVWGMCKKSGFHHPLDVVRWREHVPASSAVGTDHSVLCRVSSAAASPLDLGRGESLEWMRVYSFELAWTELFLYLKMNLIQLLPVIEDPLNLLELYSKSKNENLTKHACLNTEIREK